MKQIFIFLATALVAISCSNEKTTNNIEKMALVERTSSDEFKQYADTAIADSLYNVAALFEAISASKDIHSKNYANVYKSLSGKEVNMLMYVTDVAEDNTLANLSIVTEKLTKQLAELDATIKMAEEESGTKEALKSLSTALGANGKAMNFIEMAINSITQDGNDSNIFSEWIVCPNCGDLYRQGDLFDVCDICDTEASKFVVFKAKNLQ